MGKKIIMALCVVLSCVPAPGLARQTGPLPQTKEKCEAAGGNWGQVGCMMKQEGCEIIASDAGKPCHDGSECQFQCISEDYNIKAGAEAAGICSRSSNACGCFARIEKGRATPVLCID